jgi:hypothetical protein
MRRSSRLFNQSTDEVGWISTTDMFVVACCFLLFMAVVLKRRAGDAEDRLGSVTQQLEMSKAASDPDVAQKIDAMTNEREELISRLKSANDRIERIADQQSRENASELTEKQALASQIKKLEDGLNLSESEIINLKEQLAGARKAATDARVQAISQQRAINNKLVGLGGKLENVVFMVDTSKSMQSGKGPNGVVLNNWVPIVEVIERWINGLNVTSAALIVFGDSAEVKVQMQRLSDGGRERILEVLKEIDPNADGTNFLAAFEEAYRIPNVDTIIVFSDGLPSVDINGNRIFVAGRNNGESEDAYKARVATTVTENVSHVLAVHRKISDMAKQHPNVAVNVIGLGSGVYNERTGNLLNDLALKNGGVFIALPSRILLSEGNEK